MVTNSAFTIYNIFLLHTFCLQLSNYSIEKYITSLLSPNLILCAFLSFIVFCFQKFHLIYIHSLLLVKFSLLWRDVFIHLFIHLRLSSTSVQTLYLLTLSRVFHFPRCIFNYSLTHPHKACAKDIQRCSGWSWRGVALSDSMHLPMASLLGFTHYWHIRSPESRRW